MFTDDDDSDDDGANLQRAERYTCIELNTGMIQCCNTDFTIL